MTGNDVVLWLLVIGIIAFIIYCPILKPWFGFRKPPQLRGDARYRWFQ